MSGAGELILRAVDGGMSLTLETAEEVLDIRMGDNAGAWLAEWMNRIFELPRGFTPWRPSESSVVWTGQGLEVFREAVDEGKGDAACGRYQILIRRGPREANGDIAIGAAGHVVAGDREADLPLPTGGVTLNLSHGGGVATEAQRQTVHGGQDEAIGLTAQRVFAAVPIVGDGDAETIEGDPTGRGRRGPKGDEGRAHTARAAGRPPSDVDTGVGGLRETVGRHGRTLSGESGWLDSREVVQ